MENCVTDRTWGSAKLFMMQNYTDNGNGDVPLIVEIIFFNLFWDQDAFMFLRKEKEKWSILCPFQKNRFIKFPVCVN